MDPTQQAKFLQAQINRYVKITGLAPLAVDGVIGPRTAIATKAALNAIVSLSSPYLEGGAKEWKDYYGFAFNYLGTTDVNQPSTVAKQAWAIADLLQKFGNFNGAPILKDAAPTTTTTKASTAVAVTAPTAPATGMTPTIIAPPSAVASVSVLGLKMPKWMLFVGGGAIAVAVIALIATRKKSNGASASVAGVKHDSDDARGFGQYAFRMGQTKAAAVASARAEGFGKHLLDAVEDGWEREQRDTRRQSW